MGIDSKALKGEKKSSKSNPEDARERVLQAAESLFSEFGYNAVTVQDIAKKLGIKPASLYYHAPGGKEELYMMVIERALTRHANGIAASLLSSGPGIRQKCHGVITWFLSQGPLGFLRLLISDLPGLDPRNGERLRHMAQTSLIQPIVNMVDLAVSEGEIQPPSQPQLLASSLLSMVDGIWYASKVQTPDLSLESLIDGYIAMLIDGLAPR